MLREGKLDDKEIEIEVARAAAADGDPRAARHGGPDQPDPGHVPADGRAASASSRKMKVARGDEAADRRGGGEAVNDDELKTRRSPTSSRTASCSSTRSTRSPAARKSQGADVSRQGVQRDLLPLVEGTTVSTKYGMIKTDHILFIASGAFHLSKPSDLIPELQGRFPIRVELDVAVGRRLRADPDRDRRLPDAPVPGAARHRARAISISSRTASGGSPKSPSRSTRSRRTSARGACTR